MVIQFAVYYHYFRLQIWQWVDYRLLLMLLSHVDWTLGDILCGFEGRFDWSPGDMLYGLGAVVTSSLIVHQHAVCCAEKRTS